jgi:hypothetical protein
MTRALIVKFAVTTTKIKPFGISGDIADKQDE